MVQRDQCDTYWGAKIFFFLIRDIDDDGRVDGILSICDPEVSQGPLLVGSRRAQAPTARAPPLPSVCTYQAKVLNTLINLSPSPPSFNPERLQAPAMRPRRLPDLRITPRGRPGADIHPKKVNNLAPMALRPRQIRNYPRAPSSRRSGLVGPHTTPAIVNYKYRTSTL